MVHQYISAKMETHIECQMHRRQYFLFNFFLISNFFPLSFNKLWLKIENLETQLSEGTFSSLWW